MIINYSIKAEYLLNELSDVLAENYFSFDYQSDDYIDKLKNEVYNCITVLGANLPKAGKKYQATKYGNPTHFVRYKGNSRTTWYILVRINGDKALVTYIHKNNDKVHSTKA